MKLELHYIIDGGNELDFNFQIQKKKKLSIP